MNELKQGMVFPTTVKDSRPGLESFQADVCGSRAVLNAFHDLESGTVENAIVADCTCDNGRWSISASYLLGVDTIDGKRAFRYLSTGGASSVVATWYPDAMDPAVAAVTLALCIKGQAFRLRVVERGA